MTVLTWRNLAVPVAGPESALEFASRAFNAGMNNFNRGLESYQTQQGDAFQAAKAKNMQEFTDSLRSQFKTPEAYQAALQSGEIDRMRQQYGDRIDANAAMRLADSRLGTLRNEVLQTNDYNSTQQKFAAAPLIDQAKAYYAKGQFDKGDEVISGNVDKLRNYLGDLASYRNSSQIGLNSLKASNRSESVAEATAADNLKYQVARTKNALTEQNDLTKQITDKHIADNLVQNFATQFRAAEAKKVQDLNNLPEAFGIKKDKEGNLDFKNADPLLVDEFKKELARRRNSPEGTASDFYNRAAVEFSKLHPTIAKAGLDQLGTMLNPEALLSPYDRANLETKVANINKDYDQRKATNPFYQDYSKLPEQQAAFMEKVKKDMNDEDLTVNSIRDKIDGLLRNGVTVNGKNRLVSMEVIKQAYATTFQNNTRWSPNNSERELEKNVQNILKNPNNEKLLKQADEIYMEQDKKDKQDLIREYTRRAGHPSSDAELNKYERNIAAMEELAKAQTKIIAKNKDPLKDPFSKESLEKVIEDANPMKNYVYKSSNKEDKDTNVLLKGNKGIDKLKKYLFN